MPYSDNPVADFSRLDFQQSKELEQLPVCHHCEDPIQQEYAVRLEGHWYCDDCLHDLREEIEVF